MDRPMELEPREEVPPGHAAGAAGVGSEFYVVGIGASAGGLDALRALFTE